MEHVLKFPHYATLDRLEHRRNIEHFKPGCSLMLKSAYRWGSCLAGSEKLSISASVRWLRIHTLWDQCVSRSWRKNSSSGCWWVPFLPGCVPTRASAPREVRIPWVFPFLRYKSSSLACIIINDNKSLFFHCNVYSIAGWERWDWTSSSSQE